MAFVLIILISFMVFVHSSLFIFFLRFCFTLQSLHDQSVNVNSFSFPVLFSVLDLAFRTFVSFDFDLRIQIIS